MRKLKPIDEILVSNSITPRNVVKGILMKEKLIPYCCKKCEIVDVWQNEKINLHLDHINGINNDNRIENLRFLCPNCHSQTKTYCSNTQSRYTDEDILKESVGASSIRQVMLKMNMTTGTNYKRIKKLLPDLVKKQKDILVKENGDLIQSIISEKISKLPRPTTRKVNRPSKIELEKMIEEKSILQISKDYGVSDNAIRKWCKRYDIKTKPVGYWQKIKFNN